MIRPFVSPASPARRRATAAVEFAIVAPLLVMLIFGMIEFGRVMMAMELLNNAARNGARQAVINGSTTKSVETTVSDTLNSTTIKSATVKVLVDGKEAEVSDSSTGAIITVTVTVDAEKVSWLPRPFFMGSKTLGSTVIMRRE